MDIRAKKAIGKNRVKILQLDYFDLTAPLLAGDILPIKVRPLDVLYFGFIYQIVIQIVKSQNKISSSKILLN